MTGFKETLKITSALITHIERISLWDGVFDDYKLIPIQNTTYFYFSRRLTQDSLLLPKLYAALTYLTGPNDDWYDAYKGSYSFTFKLEIQKNGVASQYFYHIYHFRSFIEFDVYHIVSSDDPCDSSYMHNPNDELFSDKDIWAVSNFFCNFALGYMEGAQHTPQPFLKYADSNFLCFGYFGDKYFVKSYEDQDKYEKEKKFLLRAVAK